MLELLDWNKKRGDGASDAPAEPGVSSDAATALAELAGRLESEAAAEPRARNEALARLQDAGEPHVAALLARCLEGPGGAGGSLAAREATWKSLADYQTRLTRVACTAAGAYLTAQAAARALGALRLLAKIYLVHYESVPGRVWRVAYALHAAAEKARCAGAPVHARADRRAVTTVEQELLRLLMLRISAPDMMPPAQIELTDRVVEQLGPEFTLRLPGVADNPFCFEPESEFPPRRAKGRDPSATARYFGPGVAYDSLERIVRRAQGNFREFGKDLEPRTQLGGLHHLLAFWKADSPYAPPAHSPATGTLEVVHDFRAVWQYLSRSGASGLSLTEYTAPSPPETWTLGGVGGGELGAEVPFESRTWVRCGCVVGYARDGGDAREIGLVRRMHAKSDGSLHADIAVLNAAPRAVALREVLEKGEDSVFTNASSRQFGSSHVNAVILADGTDGRQPANLLLPADHWREGRMYETSGDTPPRYLRTLKAVRHGEDFVRATFAWIERHDPSVPVAVPTSSLPLEPG
ncbi:MAG TPA: hypothetical protein VFV84_05735 [Burkholderiales bacterium]|nr:hypothetical protein [Burkholderiales bacterium]